MAFLWLSYGFPMVFLWFSYGFPMVFLWFSYGFPMVFRWLSYGFPMVFLWFSYGFHMISYYVFLLFSYGFHMFTNPEPVVVGFGWFLVGCGWLWLVPARGPAAPLPRGPAVPPGSRFTTRVKICNHDPVMCKSCSQTVTLAIKSNHFQQFVECIRVFVVLLLHIGSRKSLRGSPICNPGQDLQH